MTGWRLIGFLLVKTVDVGPRASLVDPRSRPILCEMYGPPAADTDPPAVRQINKKL